MSSHDDFIVDERTSRMSRVLEEVTKRRAAGEVVDDTTIIGDHRDLLPELAKKLEALQLVEHARTKARMRVSGEPLAPSAAVSFLEAARNPSGKSSSKHDERRRRSAVRRRWLFVAIALLITALLAWVLGAFRL